MKRIISIILCVILAFSCCVVASASENPKFCPELNKKLSECHPEEPIKVCLFFNGENDTVEDMPSWPDLGAARKELSDYNDKKHAEYCSVIFENIEYEEIFYSRSVLMAVVVVKAEDIFKLGEFDIVGCIYLYRDKEFEPYGKEGVFRTPFLTQFDIDEAQNYKELYFHTDESGILDWVLVQGDQYMASSPVFKEVVIGDVLVSAYESYPFELSFGIYDANEEMFVDLCDVKNDYSKYDGLMEALVGNSGVRLIGDIDNDDKISVLDATMIQRSLAEIDNIRYNELIVDFDRDSDITILDATAIQLKLAGLE